jgi:nucleolar protein 58
MHTTLSPHHQQTNKPKQQVVKLKAFDKFENTTEALAAATALVDSKLSKGLKKFLKKHAEGDTLAVLDAKLGSLIKEKLGISCVAR